MDWRFRVARMAILVRVPFGYQLRKLKRRFFGYEPDYENLTLTLAHFRQMSEALSAVGRTFEGATVLEIGTGWFPAIPIMLTLNGAKKVLMSDLTPHLDRFTFASTLRFLKSAMPSSPHLARIRSMEDIPLEYLAPFDVQAIPDRSIDMVISRTVLEHIPPDGLGTLLQALHSKLADNGLMVHLIDNSDHLEHADKSISKVHFLTWPSNKHALVNLLTKVGENRLRHHEYPPIFKQSGYRVVSEAMEIHEPTHAIVHTLPLVAPYASMSAAQLAALTSLFVIQKARPIDISQTQDTVDHAGVTESQ